MSVRARLEGDSRAALSSMARGIILGSFEGRFSGGCRAVIAMWLKERCKRSLPGKEQSKPTCMDACDLLTDGKDHVTFTIQRVPYA